MPQAGREGPGGGGHPGSGGRASIFLCAAAGRSPQRSSGVAAMAVNRINPTGIKT